MFEAKLISLYSYVEEKYETELKYHCQRFSNNSKPVFSDVETLTLYLFAVSEENQCLLRHIHNFGKRHLKSWFPKLPSYQAFVARMNRLAPLLPHLCAAIGELMAPEQQDTTLMLTDSMPIITCSAKREAKVATELVSKGYCASKSLYYYGVKLHTCAARRPGTLPWPQSMTVSAANEHDLSVFKENAHMYQDSCIAGDKAYCDKALAEALRQKCNVEMLTPQKAAAVRCEVLERFDKAADSLFSKAVSAIKQPIESFHNYLIQHTNIQVAAKVRSTKGLTVHIFGRVAAALLKIAFNP